MKSKIIAYIKTFEEKSAHMSSSSKLRITILVIWMTIILAFSFIGIFISDVLWFVIYGMSLSLAVKCYLSLYLFEILLSLIITLLLDIFLMSVMGVSVKNIKKMSPVLTLMFFMTTSYLINYYRMEASVINRVYHHSFIYFIMLIILLFLMYGKMGRNCEIFCTNDNL